MPVRLLSVEVSDVGRFGRKFVDLSGDAVCVVGENGAGKSTLVACVYYALTGDLGRLGRREGAVNTTRSAPGTQPFVRLTLSPGGDPADVATVTRWLPDGASRGRRRLVHADRVLTSDADVDRAVGAWLGLPPAAVADFVFVAQGRLTAVLEDPPAKRAEVLHKLFAVGGAERGREAALEAIKNLPAPPDRAVAAEARARAAELSEMARDADRRLSGVPEYPADVRAAAAGLVAAARRREAILPSLVAAEARLARLEAAASAPPPAVPPRADRLAADAQAWSAYRDAADARDRLLEAAARAADEAAAKVVPPDPGPEPAPPDASGLTLFEAVAACAPGADCPVCRQPVPGGFDTSAAAGAAAEVRAALGAHEGAKAAWVSAKRIRREAIAGLASARRMAADFAGRAGPPPAPPDHPEPAPGEVAAAAAAVRAWAAAGGSRGAAAAELPDARAEAESLRARVPAEVGDADRAAAEHLMVAAAAADRLRDRLAGEAEAAARAAESNAAVVAAALAAEEAAEESAGWREVLGGAVAVLHRDAAPAMVVRKRLGEMTGAINAAAARLGADFAVAVGADGELTPTRGGRPVPRLSGGQAAVLALAWRLALAPGLLCLDEPTYGLDDVRIARLRAAVEGWRDARGGGQLVVVTHDRRLVGAFDRVVEL